MNMRQGPNDSPQNQQEQEKNRFMGALGELYRQKRDGDLRLAEIRLIIQDPSANIDATERDRLTKERGEIKEIIEKLDNDILDHQDKLEALGVAEAELDALYEQKYTLPEQPKVNAVPVISPTPQTPVPPTQPVPPVPPIPQSVPINNPVPPTPSTQPPAPKPQPVQKPTPSTNPVPPQNSGNLIEDNPEFKALYETELRKAIGLKGNDPIVLKANERLAYTIARKEFKTKQPVIAESYEKSERERVFDDWRIDPAFRAVRNLPLGDERDAALEKFKIDYPKKAEAPEYATAIESLKQKKIARSGDPIKPPQQPPARSDAAPASEDEALALANFYWEKKGRVTDLLEDPKIQKQMKAQGYDIHRTDFLKFFSKFVGAELAAKVIQRVMSEPSSDEERGNHKRKKPDFLLGKKGSEPSNPDLKPKPSIDDEIQITADDKAKLDGGLDAETNNRANEGNLDANPKPEDPEPTPATKPEPTPQSPETITPAKIPTVVEFPNFPVSVPAEKVERPLSFWQKTKVGFTGFFEALGFMQPGSRFLAEERERGILSQKDINTLYSSQKKIDTQDKKAIGVNMQATALGAQLESTKKERDQAEKDYMEYQQKGFFGKAFSRISGFFSGSYRGFKGLLTFNGFDGFDGFSPQSRYKTFRDRTSVLQGEYESLQTKLSTEYNQLAQWKNERGDTLAGFTDHIREYLNPVERKLQSTQETIKQLTTEITNFEASSKKAQEQITGLSAEIRNNPDDAAIKKAKIKELEQLIVLNKKSLEKVREQKTKHEQSLIPIAQQVNIFKDRIAQFERFNKKVLYDHKKRGDRENVSGRMVYDLPNDPIVKKEEKKIEEKKEDKKENEKGKEPAPVTKPGEEAEHSEDTPEDKAENSAEKKHVVADLIKEWNENVGKGIMNIKDENLEIRLSNIDKDRKKGDPITLKQFTEYLNGTAQHRNKKAKENPDNKKYKSVDEAKMKTAVEALQKKFK